MQKQVIVGLGNPGEVYRDTYHNAGMLALEAMVEKPHATWKRHKSLFEYLDLGETAFVKPLTYMNESGKAVREALKKFGGGPAALVIIQDESDLPVGAFKTSFGRGAAGHKGVQSVIDALHSNQFARIRIGIRAPRETQRKKAGDFALKKITAGHRKVLEGIFKTITADIGTTSKTKNSSRPAVSR